MDDMFARQNREGSREERSARESQGATRELLAPARGRRGPGAALRAQVDWYLLPAARGGAGRAVQGCGGCEEEAAGGGRGRGEGEWEEREEQEGAAGRSLQTFSSRALWEAAMV